MHGVGILYKHSIPLITTPLDKGNDRICVLQLDNGNAYKFYMIVVYLQQQSNDNVMETIDVLDELVTECLRDGEVVIIGDTNCHFCTEVDVRCWGQTTVNARHLLRTCDNHRLKIVDISIKSESPTYTFYVEGVGKSYIDHVIVSDSIQENVHRCQVHHDSIMNTSDHLSVALDI